MTMMSPHCGGAVAESCIPTLNRSQYEDVRRSTSDDETSDGSVMATQCGLLEPGLYTCQWSRWEVVGNHYRSPDGWPFCGNHTVWYLTCQWSRWGVVGNHYRSPGRWPFCGDHTVWYLTCQWSRWGVVGNHYRSRGRWPFCGDHTVWSAVDLRPVRPTPSLHFRLKI